MLELGQIIVGPGGEKSGPAEMLGGALGNPESGIARRAVRRFFRLGFQLETGGVQRGRVGPQCGTDTGKDLCGAVPGLGVLRVEDPVAEILFPPEEIPLEDDSVELGGAQAGVFGKQVGDFALELVQLGRIARVEKPVGVMISQATGQGLAFGVFGEFALQVLDGVIHQTQADQVGLDRVGRIGSGRLGPDGSGGYQQQASGQQQAGTGPS